MLLLVRVLGVSVFDRFRMCGQWILTGFVSAEEEDQKLLAIRRFQLPQPLKLGS